MKINIANPATGRQKLIDIDDEKKIRVFYEKRISQEVEGDSIGEEYKGYVFKITGGSDKDGFAMKQGLVTNTRVRLLLDGTTSGYRLRREGGRRRKSVRGAVVGPDLAVINLVIIKRGEKEIPGLAEEPLPKRLGPKRAQRIRKFYHLTKDEDVRGYIIRRELPKQKEGKPKRVKAPKIQRLITPERIQRKRRRINLKKKRLDKNLKEAAEYNKLIHQLRKDRRQEILSRKAKQTTSHLSVGGKKSETKTTTTTTSSHHPAKK